MHSSALKKANTALWNAHWGARMVQVWTDKSLARAAHQLKGSLGTVGATGAAETALELEQKGRAGDLRGVERIVATLRKRLERVTPQLESFMKRA